MDCSFAEIFFRVTRHMLFSINCSRHDKKQKNGNKEKEAISNILKFH